MSGYQLAQRPRVRRADQITTRQRPAGMPLIPMSRCRAMSDENRPGYFLLPRKGRARTMASTFVSRPLDAYAQARLDLWRAASIELSIGPEATDALVQAGIEAVLAWLRSEAATPQALLDLYGQTHGPLGHQLRLVGSLLDPEQAGVPLGPPRLWWWVVKTAYYRRWLELTRPPAIAAHDRPA